MRQIRAILVVAVFSGLMATSAWAMAEPSSGSFGYEIYEFMDSMIGGAVALCIVIGILAYLVFFVLRTNVFGAITCAIAALIVVKIKDIAFSLGITLPF